MNEREARTDKETGDDYGANVKNMPDSDVIPTPGNTTNVGTTSVPDADPAQAGNNASWVPGETGPAASNTAGQE